MGSSYSKENAVHHEEFDQRALENLKTYLTEYNLPRGRGEFINILLFGLVGAGKSATINTFLSALDPNGRTISLVPTGNDPNSLTPELRFYKSNSVRFWDLSGWNALNNAEHTKKILKMILEGRLPPQTNLKDVNPDLDENYQINEEYKIHGVAFIFNVRELEHLSKDQMKQFQDLQNLVARNYVYRIVIGTKFDQIGVPEKYYRFIYQYKPLQEKFQKLSDDTGMDKRTMFVISNEWKGGKIELTRCVLALYALKNMIRNMDKQFKVTE